MAMSMMQILSTHPQGEVRAAMASSKLDQIRAQHTPEHCLLHRKKRAGWLAWGGRGRKAEDAAGKEGSGRPSPMGGAEANGLLDRLGLRRHAPIVMKEGGGEPWQSRWLALTAPPASADR